MSNLELRSATFTSGVPEETLAALAVGSFLMRGSLTPAALALVDEIELSIEKAFLFGTATSR